MTMGETTMLIPVLNPIEVLIPPPCGICEDRAAEWVTVTRWEVTAFLCDDCRAEYGRDECARLITAPALPELPTPAEVHDYIEAQTWVFARTMPKLPHEYVLLKRSTNLWMHLRVTAFIREHGEWRRFGRRELPYWDHGGHTYWSMPPNWAIINRAKVPEYD